MANLGRLYKEHLEKQAGVSAENARRRREVLSAVPQVADALVTSVNSSVAEIFQNQRMIEGQVRQLAAQSAQFTEQAKTWLSTIDTFNNNVKELGDFELYCGLIEGDMRTVTTTLQMITTPRGRSPQSRTGSAGSPRSV